MLLSYILWCLVIKKVNKVLLENDFNNLGKLEFLNKYQTTQIKDLNKHDCSRHISWFNYERMKKILINSGFKKENIYKSSYLKSKKEEMKNPKFFDYTEPETSLFIECIK